MNKSSTKLFFNKVTFSSMSKNFNVLENVTLLTKSFVLNKITCVKIFCYLKLFFKFVLYRTIYVMFAKSHMV